MGVAGWAKRKTSSREELLGRSKHKGKRRYFVTVTALAKNALCRLTRKLVLVQTFTWSFNCGDSRVWAILNMRHTIRGLSPHLPLSVIILFTMSLYWPVHWIHTHSFTSSLYWTARSWLWNHPITSDYAVWDQGDPGEWENCNKERARILCIWKFLEPYFSQRGYTLYVQKDLTDVFALQYPASKMIDPRHLSYPYAQYHCKNEEDLGFSPDSPRVWPARDKDGRDVVIKAISGAVPRNELKALRLLHSEPLCNDPRNRIIPVIEFIEFNQQTFVVMPRWCVAIECDFVTVGEIVRYARAIFETVAFLHENNIAHGDLLAQNMCMDVILPRPRDNHDYYTGYHGPERKYVLIDFETAQIHHGSGPYSPEFEMFRQRDVYLLAWSLLPSLRCIENVIPPIVDLLDSMMENDSSMTASAALSRFEGICASLIEADLNLPVAAYNWLDGHLQFREGPPTNQQH